MGFVTGLPISTDWKGDSYDPGVSFPIATRNRFIVILLLLLLILNFLILLILFIFHINALINVVFPPKKNKNANCML